MKIVLEFSIACLLFLILTSCAGSGEEIATEDLPLPEVEAGRCGAYTFELTKEDLADRPNLRYCTEEFNLEENIDDCLICVNDESFDMRCYGEGGANFLNPFGDNVHYDCIFTCENIDFDDPNLDIDYYDDPNNCESSVCPLSTEKLKIYLDSGKEICGEGFILDEANSEYDRYKIYTRDDGHGGQIPNIDGWPCRYSCMLASPPKASLPSWPCPEGYEWIGDMPINIYGDPKGRMGVGVVCGKRRPRGTLDNQPVDIEKAGIDGERVVLA
ncbi:MAG: hypothetical protein KKF44_02080 [Nanoarchaeota archaeon]|nr:hypothetical protein [Nanoarchaeota archaeon]